MSVLLDTHTFLWFVDDDPRLSATARARIEIESDPQVFLSAASLWEMAIKVSLRKLALPEAFGVFVPGQLARNAIEILPIGLDHVAIVASLPFHHRDPFDRLLVAQALIEQLPILSADVAFDAYPVQRVW